MPGMLAKCLRQIFTRPRSVCVGHQHQLSVIFSPTDFRKPYTIIDPVSLFSCLMAVSKTTIENMLASDAGMLEVDCPIDSELSTHSYGCSSLGVVAVVCIRTGMTGTDERPGCRSLRKATVGLLLFL